jgi:hypothetical protein
MVVYQLVKTRLKYGEITRNAVMDIDRLGVMAPISPNEYAGKRGHPCFLLSRGDYPVADLIQEQRNPYSKALPRDAVHNSMIRRDL